MTANKKKVISTVTKLAAIAGLAASLTGVPLAAGAATVPTSHVAAAAARVLPADCPWDGSSI